ncbi:hypothetical protein KUV62_12420 [Salipiger bermudensis]|uniref:hypothetical protein n=1 Tax=Salipiger bermudensis TaxID=344736 RepID=UPI001C99424F|nr:hypothetical protein [Salipiger bermudensis]MBY6004720.1 hypothetical protein [Salipiger bermudensis]
MWGWITQNSGALSAVLNAAMLVIWIAYLQLFFVSFRRSNRTVIHIGMAAAQGGDARCLVTNMGSDTAYVLAVKIDLDFGEESRSALVTDRVEDDDPLGGDFRDMTSEGPLAGGEALDIGSLRRIVERAARRTGEELTLEQCRAVTITVMVASQQAHRLSGGYKRYEIEGGEGEDLRFRPSDVLTRQIRRRSQRRALRELLDA